MTVLTKFVSTPDLFNADLGDVSAKRAGRGWEPGDPNSMNSSYRAAIKHVMDEMAAHDPDVVLAAGDLVEGHWGKDVDNTGIFGPVGTTQEKLAAVRNAGNLYYGEWKEFWRASGIVPDQIFPAVGDHEVGDNPWPVDGFKYQAFEEFKDVYARNFTTNFGQGFRFDRRPIGTPFEKTAYATMLTPGVLLITVDVFAKWADGVHATVTDGQLAWVRKVLESSPNAVKIVQGHVPVLTPVREVGSSGLSMEGGASSAFWRLLEEQKVDLYLCGEVHANTVRKVGHTTQISHGGLIAFGGSKYIVGTVQEDKTIDIEAHTFRGTPDTSSRLWHTSDKRPPIRVTYQEPSVVSGRISLRDGQVLSSVGDMIPNPTIGAKGLPDVAE